MTDGRAIPDDRPSVSELRNCSWLDGRPDFSRGRTLNLLRVFAPTSVGATRPDRRFPQASGRLLPNSYSHRSSVIPSAATLPTLLVDRIDHLGDASELFLAGKG